MLEMLIILCMVFSGVSLVVAVKTKNSALVKQNISIEEKYCEVLKENGNNIKRIKKLEDTCESLFKTCEDLQGRVKYLEDENRKITKTLEFYDMIAPNFKLDKPFAMKIVK